MKIKTLILSLLFSSTVLSLNAQNWNKEDSVWLLNVLEGKEELKINEETIKAIEEGKLIVPKWLQEKEKIEILKDFSNTGVPDSTHLRSINPYTMPPSVFALYVLYVNKVDSLLENTNTLLTDEERENLKQFLPPESNRIYVNGYGVGGIGNLDFNHILSMVFSPSYRLIAHNRKHATANKNYYDEGALLPSFKFTERERRQIRQAVHNIKVEYNNSIGSAKRNTIDK